MKYQNSSKKGGTLRRKNSMSRRKSLKKGMSRDAIMNDEDASDEKKGW
jgi:hypothetical protein